jgi:hypothetical protein
MEQHMHAYLTHKGQATAKVHLCAILLQQGLLLAHHTDVIVSFVLQIQTQNRCYQFIATSRLGPVHLDK